MIETLKDIFKNNSVEAPNGERKMLHSNTSLEQGLFLQQVLEEIKPTMSVEIGLAYGISSLFILEKHKEHKNAPKSHIIIEPYPWGGVAEYNIEKEDLSKYCDYRSEKSDKILPQLFNDNLKIQFAYIDTTKVFDTVLQDFYFLDKILETKGVIVFDDCGGGWPGVQKVVRFVNSLPHYKVYKTHGKIKRSIKFTWAERIVTAILDVVPFKKKLFPGYLFKTDHQLSLDYNCIAFQKTYEDNRAWNWDNPF